MLWTTRRGLFRAGGAAVLGIGALAWAPRRLFAASAPELMPGDTVIGQPDAPVTIFEYASLTCPHCAAFHNETLPELKTRFIDPGKAKLVFRHFPLDQVGAAAAMLSDCLPEARKLQFISTLFATQQDWARASNPGAELFAMAGQIGLPEDKAQACLENSEAFDRMMAVRSQAADEYGVNSTPTFFIGGEKVIGNKSVDEFAEYINDAS
jgi:protein-disulfide isomerase